MFKLSKLKLFLLCSILLLPPVFVSADYGGQNTTFFVDSDFDLLQRSQITATLIRITPSLYFYLENTWWSSLSVIAQQTVKIALQELGEEFETKIYPELTRLYGSEWRGGIDNDIHLTVLFHPMQENSAGYVDEADEYSRLQSPRSNEREMVYLNTTYLATPLIKSYLAHEFTHLITFNQKERKQALDEETWLNELRAELAPTLLGYDDDFPNSNLKKRLALFAKFPNDSLTEWQSEQADYGVLNLFGQYLVEQYGWPILADSLRTNKVGIASLNQALTNNGFEIRFSQIFADWLLTLALNDCQIKEPTTGQPGKYCFQNPNLASFKVVPKINFLALSSQISLAQTSEAKDWQGNWLKVIGGKGDLELAFAGFPDVNFRLPFVLTQKSGQKQAGFLELDSFQTGAILLKDFGQNISSIVIMPLVQSKFSDFSSAEKAYPFFWSVKTKQPDGLENGQSEPGSQESIEILLEKISFLEKQLAVLRAQLKEKMGGSPGPANPPPSSLLLPDSLTQNLSLRMSGSQVRLLQTWLSKDPAVYPEGIVSGWFGPLTQAAVARFQEKYRAEVLAPWNLTSGTGFAGSTTRAKLNQLYSNQ